jgi:hypothetical protein
LFAFLIILPTFNPKRDNDSISFNSWFNRSIRATSFEGMVIIDYREPEDDLTGIPLASQT